MWANLDEAWAEFQAFKAELTGGINNMAQIAQGSGAFRIPDVISGDNGDPRNSDDSFTGVKNPFTGMAMLYPKITIGGQDYYLVGMNAGVQNFGVDIFGRALAGGGNVILDSLGISIQIPTAWAQSNSITFVSGGKTKAYMAAIDLAGSGLTTAGIAINTSSTGSDTAGVDQTYVLCYSKAGSGSEVYLAAREEGGASPAIGITSNGSHGNIDINSNSDNDTDTQIEGATDTNLLFADASTDRIGIGTATPAVKLEVNGNILASNFLSGTYTPNLTNVTNVATSGALSCQYTRIGGNVIVSGGLSIDPTATGAIEVGLSLPIASTLSGSNFLAGSVGNNVTAANMGIVIADTTNNRARILINTPDAGNKNYFFIFMYRIA